jgi:hypothetical protein
VSFDKTYLGADPPSYDDVVAVKEDGRHGGLITHLPPVFGMHFELSFASLTLIHYHMMHVGLVSRLTQRLIL